MISINLKIKGRTEGIGRGTSDHKCFKRKSSIVECQVQIFGKGPAGVQRKENCRIERGTGAIARSYVLRTGANKNC